MPYRVQTGILQTAQMCNEDHSRNKALKTHSIDLQSYLNYPKGTFNVILFIIKWLLAHL